MLSHRIRRRYRSCLEPIKRIISPKARNSRTTSQTPWVNEALEPVSGKNLTGRVKVSVGDAASGGVKEATGGGGGWVGSGSEEPVDGSDLGVAVKVGINVGVGVEVEVGVGVGVGRKIRSAVATSGGTIAPSIPSAPWTNARLIV